MRDGSGYELAKHTHAHTDHRLLHLSWGAPFSGRAMMPRSGHWLWVKCMDVYYCVCISVGLCVWWFCHFPALHLLPELLHTKTRTGWGEPSGTFVPFVYLSIYLSIYGHCGKNINKRQNAIIYKCQKHIIYSQQNLKKHIRCWNWDILPFHGKYQRILTLMAATYSYQFNSILLV